MPVQYVGLPSADSTGNHSRITFPRICARKQASFRGSGLYRDPQNGADKLAPQSAVRCSAPEITGPIAHAHTHVKNSNRYCYTSIWHRARNPEGDLGQGRRVPPGCSGGEAPTTTRFMEESPCLRRQTHHWLRRDKSRSRQETRKCSALPRSYCKTSPHGAGPTTKKGNGPREGVSQSRGTGDSQSQAQADGPGARTLAVKLHAIRTAQAHCGPHLVRQGGNGMKCPLGCLWGGLVSKVQGPKSRGPASTRHPTFSQLCPD
jgi:hypothetical protein